MGPQFSCPGCFCCSITTGLGQKLSTGVGFSTCVVFIQLGTTTTLGLSTLVCKGVAGTASSATFFSSCFVGVGFVGVDVVDDEAFPTCTTSYIGRFDLPLPPSAKRHPSGRLPLNVCTGAHKESGSTLIRKLPLHRNECMHRSI